MRLTVSVIHNVFGDVHEHLGLRLEDRHEFDRNLVPFLHLRVQEFLEKEGLDCEAHIFLGNDLVSWGGNWVLRPSSPLTLRLFLATRFTGVGVP